MPGAKAITVFAVTDSPVTPMDLREIADAQGCKLFFLAYGGYPSPGKEREFESPLDELGIGVMLVGIPRAASGLAEEYAALLDKYDVESVANFMKTHKDVVWFEMSVSLFDYRKEVARRSATVAARIDASVAPGDLPSLQSAKTLYVFRNTGKRPSSQEFMAHFAEKLAGKVGGVIGGLPRLR